MSLVSKLLEFSGLRRLLRAALRRAWIQRIERDDAVQYALVIRFARKSTAKLAAGQDTSRPLDGKQLMVNVGGGKGHPALENWIIVDLRVSLPPTLDQAGLEKSRFIRR